MKNKILKVTQCVVIILLLGFDGNAQVKTKIFYNPVPLKYKLLIEKVSNVYEISPPNLFFAYPG